MQAINHSLTGALIGLTISRPAVAIPLAVVSHLICDALPHFGGIPGIVGTRKFKFILTTDAALCGLLVLILFMASPANWWLASICAFAAAAPDFWNFREFLYAQRGRIYKPGRIKRFLNWIQWFERPIGAFFEIAWFAACIFLLVGILRG